MPKNDDPFAPALDTAHAWLATVAYRLNTEDRRFAHRVLRAWLHTVRDRIGVVTSAHFTAQLPELLRGVYYESWRPGRVPVGHDPAAFTDQFAEAAGVTRDEVPALVDAVTGALTELCSPGQLGHVFAVLPIRLQQLVSGAGIDTMPAEVGPAPKERTAGLERRLRSLGDAVAILARGLEEHPVGDSDALSGAAAAQQAHRILMAEGLTSSAG
ncbi:DUF2267 domain-containing protein [Nocardia sp. alder85J]|uniref:DUF2267 domain-containing protein n=1 Tax=Nocardia sp. alder85J TaxID=2862949 RepID=UPI001CD3A905|nr:DUF2267 domain-containing protein [Nocardia sp. alder85J]MCX4092434.1 DUF2267 domain-containing protein [Nocardia sp. alder85J]